ncbi:hypothetical protein D9M70_566460 [compost metagenome]
MRGPTHSTAEISRNAAMDTLVCKATLINNVDTFDPDLHVLGSANEYVPGVVGQLWPALTNGTADEHQGQEADQKALHFRTLTKSHKECRAA